MRTITVVVGELELPGCAKSLEFLTISFSHPFTGASHDPLRRTVYCPSGFARDH
jgi:hypothetical protein